MECVTALGFDYGGQLSSKDVMIKPQEDILQRPRATSFNILCLTVVRWNKNTFFVFSSAGQLNPTTGYSL